MKTVIVTEQPAQWSLLSYEGKIINATDYLMDSELASSINGNTDVTPLRIINLCCSYQYQSLGYYVSLLAEARSHKVFPSVLTIQDIKTKTSHAIIDEVMEQEIQHILKTIHSDEFVLSVYFGKNIAKRYNTFCRKLHGLFPMPLFRVYFKFKKIWTIQKIIPLSINDIPEYHKNFLISAAHDYLFKQRFYPSRKKNIFYEMAILYNPHDKNPPSDTAALKKFIDAGSDLGIDVELIEKEDLKIINEYDALFIRETTAVNNHTYQFARRAMAERLVVIDDPQSILRCTNKVYLAEILDKHHIKTPATTIFSRHNLEEKIKLLTFPCVLKQPDGSFSQGVIKVNNLEEMAHATRSMFKSSELVIAQAFMPSKFDWRIGVLNYKPLFACKYYMAKDHWQIYNWQSIDENMGKYETVTLAAVPQTVLKTALQATKLIGNGLYGVDLKQLGNEVYVIEINDNPNLDDGIEDAVMGDKLYTDIMQVFLQRIKMQHGYAI